MPSDIALWEDRYVTAVLAKHTLVDIRAVSGRTFPRIATFTLEVLIGLVSFVISS